MPTSTTNDLVPLRVVVDEPTASLGLGYEKYVDALSAVITGGSPARFTIGIYGAWGVGKSSILRAVETRLRGYDIPVVTFDAWRYARNPQVIVPLLREVEGALARREEKEPHDDEKSRSDKKLWTSIGRALRAVVAEVTLNLGPVSVSGSAVGSAIDAFQQPLGRPGAEAPHGRLVEIGRELEEAEKRIVVLIDDLDRCPPDAIVQVLEAVHVLTDVQGFVFVMALDYAVLIKAVKERYATTDAPLFVEKIVQIPFWIPEVDRSEQVISDIVPNWDESLGLDEPAKRVLQDVVHLALRTNPRQVKRLVNSMMIAQRILGEETSTHVDNSLLLAMIGLQLRWPEDFKALHVALAGGLDHDRIDDYLGDEQEANTDLTTYLSKVLPPDLPPAYMLAAMRYSQTTASASAQSNLEVVEDSGDGLLAQIEGSPRAEAFARIRRPLEDRGASVVSRQQYVAFKLDGKAFLRVDAGPQIGVRLFFPDSMHVDPDDVPRFALATGARSTNFSRTLLADSDDELVRRYLDRALATVAGKGYARETS
ncbi:KAP family P-loop NTPase fold protein [Cellulomonas iranensis]|uniref:KAP family P-loop NTPase fold protein n=1 Tax=Cellulomonas iranensis TaxID=76862 RepID=UPI000B3C3E1E|nr:P-loop NTPase fold protein [Cellulomonas iranensis]